MAEEKRPHSNAAATKNPVQIISKLYDYIIWMIRKVDKFPRSQKFVLGDRIESVLLDSLTLLVEARYTGGGADKSAILRRVNLNLEQVRFLVRISKDLRFLSLNAYEFSAVSLDEVGRMLGGWIKTQKK